MGPDALAGAVRTLRRCGRCDEPLSRPAIHDSYYAAFAGIVASFLRLDLRTLEWTDLTRDTAGPAPVPRDFLGFAAAGGLLYVFGGRYTYEFKGPRAVLRTHLTQAQTHAAIHGWYDTHTHAHACTFPWKRNGILDRRRRGEQQRFVEREIVKTFLMCKRVAISFTILHQFPQFAKPAADWPDTTPTCSSSSR